MCCREFFYFDPTDPTFLQHFIFFISNRPIWFFCNNFFRDPSNKTRGLSAWQLRCLIVYAILMISNCLWYPAKLIPNDLDLTFQCHPKSNVMWSGLSGKYRGGISRAVFPGISRPVQYPPGKYREILFITIIL